MSVVDADPLYISKTRFGPVGDVVWTFRPSWTAGDGPLESGSFTGTVLLRQARQLVALLANDPAKVTVCGVTGILDYVQLGAAAVSGQSGWYIFTSAPYAPIKPGDLMPLVPLTLEATYLGEMQPVVIRSSVAIENDWDESGAAVVSEPFYSGGEDFLVPPGGVKFTREYDAAWPTGSTAQPALMTLYEAPEQTVVVPLWETSEPVIANRGGDVRAWDRYLEEDVLGPMHAFRTTTDLQVSNGLIRFTVGNRNMIPFLTVEAFAGGAWRSAGYLRIDGERLLTARLLGVTKESAEVAVTCSGVGMVVVGLRRHERMLRLQSTHRGYSTERGVTWLSVPPDSGVIDASIDTVAGRSGLVLGADGYFGVRWPEDVASNHNAVEIHWRPTTASTTMGDCGLGSVLDNDLDVVSDLRYETSDNTIRWDLEGVVLSSPPISFSVNSEVAVIARTSELGRVLTVKTDSGVSHVADATSTLANFAWLSLGRSGSTISFIGFGELGFGEGPFGGVHVTGGELANGLIDSARIHDDPGNDADMADMLTTTNVRDKLGHREGRAVLTLPFDWPMDTGVSDLDPDDWGQVHETVAVGSGTQFSLNGLTRGLATNHEPTVGPGFRFSRETDDFDVGAFIATAGDHDDPWHQRYHYRRENTQRVMVVPEPW